MSFNDKPESAIVNPVDAPRKAPLRYRLRILNQNLWHGLDHLNPYIMWPTENPMARWLRAQSQKAALKELLLPKTENEEVLEVFCLQEVNPAFRKTKELSEELGMQGEAAAINVGIRVGNLSYPPFLQEGLAILWRGQLTDTRTERKILSGHATELTGPLGVPLAFQLAERRGAMLVSGVWNGKTFTFVSLHLHNGSDANAEHPARRAREMDILMEWLDPWIQQSDAVIVAGDFNCEHGQAELSPLIAGGFEEILSARGEPIFTWDPELNPHAKNSLKRTKDPLDLKWDEKPHQIDHIFYKVKGGSWSKREDARPPWTFRIERTLDRPMYGSWPSDHFGLLAEISWTV